MRDGSRRKSVAIAAADASLGDYSLYCEGQPLLLFTENETNNQRLFGTANPTPYVKDGINDCVVADRQNAVNPKQHGNQSGRALPATSGYGSDCRHPTAAYQCRSW